MVGRIARAHSAGESLVKLGRSANGELASAHLRGAVNRHKSSFSDLENHGVSKPDSSSSGTRDASPSIASASQWTPTELYD